MENKETKFIHSFKIDETENLLPKVLKEFKTYDECVEYFSKNLISEHVSVNANRFYDKNEIEDIKNSILEILTSDIPEAKEKVLEAEDVLARAKNDKKDKEETYNSLQLETQEKGIKISKGYEEILINSTKVFRLPYKGKYYHYVYLDNGKVVLASITQMTEEEKEDLFSSSGKNEKYLDATFLNTKKK